MPTITFVEHDGTSHPVSVESGTTLMQAAMQNDVPGIVAECGGAASCATCHCYVQSDKIPPPDSTELALLDGALHTRDDSRLSCQITVTPDLDGLVVHLPVSQM